MRVRFWACLIMTAALLCGTMSVALASQGFSADIVSAHGNQTMQGKIYVAGEKMRFETAGMATITRMDRKVVWLLMPSEKMYMEQQFRPENVVPSSETLSGEVERTLLGTETVNGMVADKYRITVQTDGKRHSFLQWLAKDSLLPVKTAAEDGSWWQEYRNVKAGEPDPSLFDLPEGYKKFSMGL
ncbi:DUF4412 domain-containing protein [Anaeroselena agilis]|uniref:DUF4412 domain-containing protein n=1 Tax=Anaeroselena agilis TaxID=3063788 RepID=A0ABU3P1Y7_9FIRM|nr:DUF4412 domain-containing protein [Selenomonadales bacterium 4137-cl]